MKYLFDTDHISFLQDPQSPEFSAIAGRVALHRSADFAFSIVSFHEQTLGGHNYINRAKTPAEVVRGYDLLAMIHRSFQRANVLHYNANSATIFDQLRSQGIRIATMDLRIAAIALSQNLVLLTRNSIDFKRVPALVIEDWTV